jgi:hypothetical protein
MRRPEGGATGWEYSTGPRGLPHLPSEPPFSRRRTSSVMTNERGSLALIGSVIGVGLIAVLLIFRPDSPGESTASDSRSASAVASLDATVPSAPASMPPVSVTLPDDSYDLAYDPPRGLLWLAVMQISEPDWLYAVGTDATFERWPLPDVQHNGYLSQVEVDSHGAVWVTEGYVLARFDPDTHKTMSLSLAEEAPDALPDALDSGNPNAGTWISAIAPFGDGVLVARNNVAAFVAYDSTLEPVTTIHVAPPYAGPSDLLVTGDGIVALGSQTSLDRLAFFSLDGTLVRETGGVAGMPETRLSPARDNAMLVTGSPPSIVTLPDLDIRQVTGCGWALGATLAELSNSEDTICYDGQTATIRRVGDGEGVVAQLEMSEGEVWAPPPGGLVKIHTAPSLADMVVDKNQTLWFFILGSSELRGVQL